MSGSGLDELLYLVLYPLDVRNIHVVGGGAHIFMLLVGEDVDTNQVHLQRKRFEQSRSEHTFSSNKNIKENSESTEQPTAC